MPHRLLTTIIVSFGVPVVLLAARDPVRTQEQAGSRNTLQERRDPLNTNMLRGELVAFVWGKVPAGSKYLQTPVWLDLDNPKVRDPIQIAGKLNKLPPGRRAILNVGWYHRRIVAHPNDRIRDAEGRMTSFPSPWLEHATAEFKSRMTTWVTAFHKAGGKVDVMILDNEAELSNWAINPGYVAALKNDPRWPALAETLKPYSIERIFDLSKPDYLFWNNLQSSLLANALNEGIYKPLRERYPRVKVSNYSSSGVIAAERLWAPDLNGHFQHNEAIVGTHKSASFYASADALGRRQLVGKKNYGTSPWAQTRWLIQRARAMVRSSEVPFTPWIGNKSWSTANVAFADSPYYEEHVFHLALCGADGFYLFVANDANDSDAALLDDLLIELNGKIAVEPRRTLTSAPIPWNSAMIVSGMQIGSSHMLWRISVQPGVTKIRIVDADGGTKSLHIEPERAGLWHETPLGTQVERFSKTSIRFERTKQASEPANNSRFK